jgi:hypothetical protein
MKALSIFVAVVICLFLSADVSAQLRRPTAIEWDAACALQSAQLFASCRASGGGRWGCLFNAGVNYWSCSGSSITVADRPGQRLRAIRTGRQAVRRGR